MVGEKEKSAESSFIGSRIPNYEKAKHRPRKDNTRGFPHLSTLLLSLPASIALSGSPKRPSLAKVVQYSLPAFK
jgi:hypothetical protein